MGVVVIKGVEDEGHDVVKDNKNPQFYFAIIYGKHSMKDGRMVHEITYDIRHSLYKYQTICLRKVESTHEEF